MRVRVTTNAGHLVGKFEKRITNLTPQVKGAMLRRARAVREECVKMSSRQYASTKELRKLGHPYARARFAKRLRVERKGLPAPPFIINRQTGLFTRRWVVELARMGAGWVAKTKNLAPYGKYMRGTRKMIERPILQEADRRVRARYGKASQQIRSAVQKALKI